MSLNLEEKFKTHCNAQNLELNPNQIIIIKKLNNYYDDNFKNSLNIISNNKYDYLLNPNYQ